MSAYSLSIHAMRQLSHMRGQSLISRIRFPGGYYILCVQRNPDYTLPKLFQAHDRIKPISKLQQNYAIGLFYAEDLC